MHESSMNEARRQNTKLRSRTLKNTDVMWLMDGFMRKMTDGEEEKLSLSLCFALKLIGPGSEEIDTQRMFIFK